jgi:hypothetical protein
MITEHEAALLRAHVELYKSVLDADVVALVEGASCARRGDRHVEYTDGASSATMTPDCHRKSPGRNEL